PVCCLLGGAQSLGFESLVCNKCSFNLLGKCVNQGRETCNLNSSVCFTGRAFLPDFVGFNVQGCRDNSSDCGSVTSSSLLGVTYNTNITCCSSDNCNPVTQSGAPSTKMTFTAAVGVAEIIATYFQSIIS
uniref:UPAR/Ly6 domain-containing protein n=1 Tax=Nothobranchius furzeri TaxID=105023 RepID=A0A8C6LVN5_NOTFU